MPYVRRLAKHASLLLEQDPVFASPQILPFISCKKVFNIQRASVLWYGAGVGKCLGGRGLFTQLLYAVVCP